MVKPHSPIVQCRTSNKQSESTQKSSTTTTTLCLPAHGRNNKDLAKAGSFSSSNINNVEASRGSSVMKRARRVSFSKTVMVKETLHINNMSEKVRNQYWLTEEDQIAIKIHCQESVLRMINNDPDIDTENSDFCSRGLESRTREGTLERNKRKLAARRAVLLQVQLQQDEGIHDPHFIAAVSVTKTKASAERARQLALQDAEEAWAYLHHKTRSTGKRRSDALR